MILSFMNSIVRAEGVEAEGTVQLEDEDEEEVNFICLEVKVAAIESLIHFTIQIIGDPHQ